MTKTDPKWAYTSMLSRCPNCNNICSVRASEEKRQQKIWCSSCLIHWRRTVCKWRKDND